MCTPIISVIVPIYNVEKYLQRCVNSILSQTYTNLEVILVDDGSPDSCGKICDEFAKKDKRVIVIHQQNSGLSAARNSGLDIAHGEYIGFVDSDDFLHHEMYERLYNDIIHYNVKLAFCQPNMCYGQVPEIIAQQPTQVINSYDLIPICLKESIWFSANTKLYHRSLFEDIRYPAGLTNEDYPTTIPIFDKCDKIAVNYNKLYNYCIRENSICTSHLNIRKFDCIITSQFILNYMKEKHPEWIDYAEVIYVTNLIGLLSKIYNEDNTHKFQKQKIDIFKRIKSIYYTALKNKNIKCIYKILLTAAYIHPNIYFVFNKLVK